MPFIPVMTKPDLSFLASCSFSLYHSSLPLPLYNVQTGIERYREEGKQALALMTCSVTALHRTPLGNVFKQATHVEGLNPQLI